LPILGNKREQTMFNLIRKSGLIPASTLASSSAPAQMRQRLLELVLNQRTRSRGGGYYKLPIVNMPLDAVKQKRQQVK
jgi:hypothetical protein